jgi:hypothetical protein
MMNYFLVGWYADHLDHFYLPSWEMLLSLIAVFVILSNIALAVIRYRTGQMTFVAALWLNIKWFPFITTFFGGLSFHVGQALLAHLFKYNMVWGATAKEKEDSNFFREVPRIFRTYPSMYALIFATAGAMIYLANWAPHGWEITEFTLIVPLAMSLGFHALAPFVLNPSLMVFNY